MHASSTSRFDLSSLSLIEQGGVRKSLYIGYISWYANTNWRILVIEWSWKVDGGLSSPAKKFPAMESRNRCFRNSKQMSELFVEGVVRSKSKPTSCIMSTITPAGRITRAGKATEEGDPRDSDSDSEDSEESEDQEDGGEAGPSKDDNAEVGDGGHEKALIEVEQTGMYMYLSSQRIITSNFQPQTCRPCCWNVGIQSKSSYHCVVRAPELLYLICLCRYNTILIHDLCVGILQCIVWHSKKATRCTRSFATGLYDVGPEHRALSASTLVRRFGPTGGRESKVGLAIRVWLEGKQEMTEVSPAQSNHHKYSYPAPVEDT